MQDLTTGGGPSVVIVGSGFGGLAAAIELKRNGLHDIVIYEKAGTVGGVWRDNRYPGAACDVPSVIYSFSHALKPDWSGVFGKQAEIQAYLEKVADEYDLHPHLQFNTEVTAATFDEGAGRWQVDLSSGASVEADAVIMATGQLSRPKMPDVVGLEKFEGASFHSAEWDHSVDLDGKRVIVVGSGASAIQIVPAIVDQVSELTVVQRSPNWVIRKSKRQYGILAKLVLTLFPFIRKLHHNALFLAYETRWPLVLRSAKLMRVANEWYYKQVIRKHLKTKDEIKAATPDYTMLCNRLLLSNDWYPALGKPHARLVGSAVREVVSDGVITTDGRHVPGDVIVWCTGFKASEFLQPIKIIGRDGVHLHDRWRHGAEAYLGITVAGFPNMFMLFGPNTNSITNTIVFLLERQARYIRKGLQQLHKRGGGWFDLKSEEHEEFQVFLQEKLDKTVFTDTCPGWYTNAEGKVTAMWPLSHLHYARMTREFDTTKYVYGSSSGESMPTTQKPKSLAEAFQATAQHDPNGVALRSIGGSVSITWGEYAERVRAIATGLAAFGIGRGDTVALMMTNRPEFHLVDTAAYHLGATPFSVYNTSSPEQIAFVLGSAKPRIVICEEQFLPALRKAAEGSSVEHLVCIDGSPDGASTLADLERSDAAGFDFEAAWRSVGPGDTLTLIYTSGTTGDPKGVQITHANMLAELEATNAVMRARFGDAVLSFLPSAHIADRYGSHYLNAYVGVQVTSVAERTQVLPAMVDARPTLFGAVPQMWTKVRAGIEAMIAAEPDEAKRAAIQQAIEVGKKYVLAKQAGDVPPQLEVTYRDLDGQVFSAIRAKLGLDRARFVQSGAAPIPQDTLVFFNALGIPLVDAWGMSELSCFATMTPEGQWKMGTIGKPLPGVEIATAEDGELLVRGPIVMKGYLGRADLTAETLDADGWLHTGDIGSVDEDGYVRIVDRKKELIINAYGKNMSPANIEKAAKSGSALIGQVVTIGDDRSYNVGLVVLDQDAAAQYAVARKLPVDPEVLAHDEQVRAIVAKSIEEGNAMLSRVEQIKKFAILPTFWEPGSDVLTHTMKLRRKPIAERYAAEIEALYADDSTEAR